jgi:hypothetical protein
VHERLTVLVLDATTREIEILLAAAVATTQLPITAHYVDVTTTAYTPGSANTATNGTTAVDAVDAPGASTQRNVKHLTVYNADTAAATVTVRYDDNATTRILVKITLAVSDTLQYTDEEGWSVIDSNGRRKTILSAPSGSGDTLCTFVPASNEPPTTNFATYDRRNAHPVLDFDTTTQEAAIFSGIMPAHYAGGGVTVKVHFMLSSATSGTVGWDVAFERMGDGGDDMDADSFAAAATITAETVPGTTGVVGTASVNIANGAAMDSVVAGDAFRLRIRRDVATDTAAGDAELLAVEVAET